MVSKKDIILELKSLSDEDFLYSSKSKLLEYKLNVLDYNDLKDIPEHLDEYTAPWYFVRYIIDKIDSYLEYKKKKDTELFVRNESVEVLLALYKNKKSGRVQEARKKLQSRYFYLAYDEQLMIMRMFMKGGKTERLWCYNALLKLWTDELKDDVMDLWLKYKEERCGWLLTKYFSIEEIRPFVDELKTDSNYYRLCTKLASQDWFIIDFDKLKYNYVPDDKLLWVMSLSKNTLSEEDAMTYIYKRIAKVISCIDSHIHSNSRMPFTKEIKQLVPNFEFIHYYMSDIKDVDKMLISICRMGHYEAVKEFLELDQKIHDSVIDEFLDYAMNNPEENIICVWASEYIENFPLKYKHILDECLRNKPSEETSPNKERYSIVSKETIKNMLSDNENLGKLISTLNLEITDIDSKETESDNTSDDNLKSMAINDLDTFPPF